MQPSCFLQSEPPRILSCHRYPVGSLLSFRWRALVSSGHALQGQTCQDLATYNIKHSFSQRKAGRFPKLPDRFFLDTPLCSTDRSFLRPGRFIFLLLFDSVFQRQEATKIKGEKNSLSKSAMLFLMSLVSALTEPSFKICAKSQTCSY